MRLACRSAPAPARIPKLPEPRQRWIPTVEVAHATGWAQGAKPVAAEGLQVRAFAEGLNHPRWLYVLPNGDVLVAETNTPPQAAQTGLMAWIMRTVMGWAGAGVPSPNRLILLRDADGDGVAETQSTFLTRLNSPFGMALIGDSLYVANTDAVLRFPYREGDTSITAPGSKVADLPAGDYNYHWTKNIIASQDGSKLFAAVGSNSNAAENGIAAETRPGRNRRDRSRRRARPTVRVGPAQSGRHGAVSPRAARCGSRSTSATSSAATSSPTT